MKLHTFVSVALFGIAVAGCSSPAPTYSDLHDTEPATAAGSGRLYFYRPGDVGESAIRGPVKVNGAVVGDAVPAGYFYVDEPAGTYEVSTSANATEAIHVIVRAGDAHYVRLDVSLDGPIGGRVVPRLVWPDEGKSEIAKCYFTGAKSN